MSIYDILLMLLAALVLLPIMAFMVVKFGVAGYYQARRREKQRQNNH